MNYINKILIPLFISVAFCLIAGSCNYNSNKERNTLTHDISEEIGAPTFFGDSTLTIISSNKPNGYNVKFFQTKYLTLINLTRGDSINQYIALHEIPESVRWEYLRDLTDGIEPMAIGTYIREIKIPIEKSQLGWGLFFMDVNFDGEEELVIAHPGYNRTYYACFDIVNGEANITPGILHSMDEEPYNNIVTGDGIDTEFDFKNKTIHIFESLGCCSYQETWCEMVSDYEYDEPKIQVVRREYVENMSDYVIKKIYKRIDGELKEVSSTREKQ